jgi:hypothetical protein
VASITSTYDERRKRIGRISGRDNAPEPRSVQPPTQGRAVEVVRVGGLHHEYLRRAP